MRTAGARPAAALLALALALAVPPARASDGGHGDGGHGDGQAAPAADAHGGHGAPPKPIEPLPVTPRSLPVELVRTLQLLQDRIARGSTQAHAAQRGLLGHIEGRLTALEPATWAAPENTRAAVAFALAGGGPIVLKRIRDGGTLPEAEAPLVLGALAYLEGREKEARGLLFKVDPRAMGPSLAGQLALTQAAVIVREAPLRAIELLGLARLLAPGTLVEESALRREIFAVAQGGNVRRFEALSVQYLHRFRRSVYAGNFRQRFATALTRLDFSSDSDRAAGLERMLAAIEPEGRRDLYLLVARAALDQGRRGTAIFAAERAAGLADPATGASAQARLYRAAALIVAEGRFEEGLDGLRGVERADLPEADRRLLDDALSAAGQIRDLARPARPAPARAPTPDTAAEGPRRMPEAAAIGRAREALARADRMIDRNDP